MTWCKQKHIKHFLVIGANKYQQEADLFKENIIDTSFLSS